jgi:hypothetical protein
MSALQQLMPIIMLLSIAIASPAQAHNRSQSFSVWTIDQQQLTMLYTVKAREATRFQPSLATREASLTNHLEQTIQVSQAGVHCAPAGPFQAMAAQPGYLRIAASFNCPQNPKTSPPEIQIASFFSLVSSHIHYARLAMGKQIPQEYLFTEGRQQQSIELGDTSQIKTVEQVLLQYVVLGTEHIFTGYDHIAFLLALLLMLRSLRDIVWLVSGFTLGHSITLSLAVLGWISPETTIVEALIGFTIALVAAENIGSKTGANRPIAYGAASALGLMLLLSLTGLMTSSLPLITLVGLIIFTLSYLPANGEFSTFKMRPALSLAFGLIHGFGFAAILQEVGLPKEQLWPALLGFNIGVELGQLLIVAALWLIYLRFKKNKEFTSSAADLCSAALCGLGLFWFVARSYGPTIG